jgi:hypothetical protein
METMRWAPPDELAVMALERRRHLARELHVHRPGVASGLAHLRAQIDTYRAHAIALNARLARLEPTRPEFAEIRAQLVATSTRLDRALDGVVPCRARRATR